MSTAKIDQNDKATWLAYNETTGNVETVRVDPVFGAVEIYVTLGSSATPTTLNTAKIDGNDRGTLLGYNETSGSTEAIRCDTNGNLLVILQ